MMNYWLKRAVDVAIEDEKGIMKDVVGKMIESYDMAIVDIKNSITKLYSTFQSDNNMNYQQAQEILTGSEFRVWRKTMREYQDMINRETDQETRNLLQLELNTLAMRTRITRLEALESEIKVAVDKLSHEENILIGKGVEEMYKERYYKSMYELTKVGNKKAIDLTTNHLIGLNDEAVMRVITMPWSGANYSKRIWHRNYNVANSVMQSITRHLQSGEDVRRLIDEMSDTMKAVPRHNVERLLQTELTFARGQADIKMYDDLGVTRYRYLATLDLRTSKECQNLDGKEFEIRKAVPGTNYPPMHPNCRSTTVPLIDDEDIEDDSGTRAARNEKGKTHWVDSKLNYNEWKEKYVLKGGTQVTKYDTIKRR